VPGVPLQVLSAYPSLPPPVPVPLYYAAPFECPYLPGRQAESRAFLAEELPPSLYHRFMDAGFRRSGKIFYQPICKGCRQCIALRVPVARFAPRKTQRRCLRRNQDLKVTCQSPLLNDEKMTLYERYKRDWHGSDDATMEELESFLYATPVDVLEFEYRDPAGRLIAVGICDVCDESLSSVYFYFDPAYSSRSLGTYGALHEIAFAVQHGIPYYYLGYYVAGCQAMRYKADFRPAELLGTDGAWREI
jgi:arginine-tRNA-protein transferase